MKSRCSRTTRETEATYHALFTNIQADRLTLPAVLSHPTSFPHISFTLAFHSAITTPHLSLPPHTSSFTYPSTPSFTLRLYTHSFTHHHSHPVFPPRNIFPFSSFTPAFRTASITPSSHIAIHFTPAPLHSTFPLPLPYHPSHIPQFSPSPHPILPKQKSPVCLSTDRTGIQSVIRTIILR